MLYTQALASNSTFPSGRVDDGPSVASISCPPMAGIVGPAVHAPDL